MQEALFRGVVRFGPFELDLKAGELHTEGRKVLLQEQSLLLLKLLLTNPGKVLTRDEIRERLWPNGTVVEFDRSINAAIKKLRAALGDSSTEPRFIETVARRGYRLMTPVNVLNITDRHPSPPQEPARPIHSNLTGAKISHYRVLELLWWGDGHGVQGRGSETWPKCRIEVSA